MLHRGEEKRHHQKIFNVAALGIFYKNAEDGREQINPGDHRDKPQVEINIVVKNRFYNLLDGGPLAKIKTAPIQVQQVNTPPKGERNEHPAQAFF